MKICKLLFFSSLFLLSVTANCQIVTGGNIAKYYFDDSTADDAIGTNDGVIYGATLCPDRCGNVDQAFEFNNAYIRIDHDSALDFGTGDFSISAWFKTDNYDSYTVIFNKGEGSLTVPRVFIRTMQSPEYTFEWRVGNGVNNVVGTYTDTSFFDNQWHHVALVRNSNSLSFYLDAVLVDVTNNSQLSSINVNSDRPIIIGAQDSVYRSSGNIPISNYFDGQLDDYRIYDRAINSLEVDSLYREKTPCSLTNILYTSSKPELLVSPNPTFDEVRIDLSPQPTDNLQFEVIDNLGRAVLFGNLKQSTINLSSIATGVYYIRISNQERLIGVSKIIKLE